MLSERHRRIREGKVYVAADHSPVLADVKMRVDLVAIPLSNPSHDSINFFSIAGSVVSIF